MPRLLEEYYELLLLYLSCILSIIIHRFIISKIFYFSGSFCNLTRVLREPLTINNYRIEKAKITITFQRGLIDVNFVGLSIKL